MKHTCQISKVSIHFFFAFGRVINLIPQSRYRQHFQRLKMTENAKGDVVPPDKHTVLLQKYIKIGDNNSHGLT